MARSLSGFSQMWEAYPNPAEGASAAKATIGGAANVEWIANTCALRLSRCLNAAGYPLPAYYPGLFTVRGADGLRYAIRVEETRRYLTAEYGAPALQEKLTQPGGTVPASFVGKKGIIAFVVDDWNDATGHLDLWDGAQCRHQAYFHRAVLVQLWLVGEGPGPVVVPTPTPSTATPPLGGSVGAGGQNRRDDVIRVQDLLRARGFDAGASDGLVGPRTIDAIKRLQARFLARPDGRVDPGGRTWRELNGLTP